MTIRLYAGSYELETIDRPNRIKSPRQDEAAQARYIHVDTPADRALWITATASDSGKQIWIDVHFTTRMLAALGNPAWNGLATSECHSQASGLDVPINTLKSSCWDEARSCRRPPQSECEGVM